METNSIQSKLNVSEFTPQNTGNRLFSIPVYQRLYAWEDKQINELLMDLKNSPSNHPYYLGNITTDIIDDFGRHDLIDGQQRITTLFLLATVLTKYDNRWNNFIKHNNDLRLLFPSREKDMQFIQTAAQGETKDDEAINRRLPAAIKLIQGFIENTLTTDEERIDYSKHVYEQLKLVHVELPKGTDMNWYFEIMNSRGEQLEKHEILKARILDKVPENLRYAYSRIWNACSQMDLYVEDVMDENTSRTILAYNGTDDSLNKIIAQFEKSNFEGEEPHTLSAILEKNKKYDFKEVKGSTSQVSSIVNFSEFLLLAYAVFKKTIPNNFSEKNLLDIFSIRNNFDCMSFVQHLLKMRLLFDSYIIKSIAIENQLKWEITCSQENIENAQEFVRSKMDGMIAYLQSMLYVSNAQQEYWLIPFLCFINENQIALYEKENSERSKFLLDWLEKYDNEMAKGRLTQRQLRQVAEASLKNDISPSIPVKVDYNKLLDRGVGTERYWFFKLDYLLLKYWKLKGIPEQHENNKKFIDRFQFRQSRSVEHVYPQHPEEPNTRWDKNDLDSFGNLALISNSTNSSYNHWLPPAKKEQFRLHNEKWGLESLKLLVIYSYEDWTTDNSNKHKNEMVEILKKSFI
jgi:uncharacterized protein with ParB-like and HNH nuclease domain